MKTPEDFKNKVEQNSIWFWPIGICSRCKLPAGTYHFVDDKIFLEINCDCSPSFNLRREETWKGVADAYNLETNPILKKDYDDFWEF